MFIYSLHIESCAQGEGPAVSFVSGDAPIQIQFNQNRRVNDVVVQVSCFGDNVLYEILAFNPPNPMFLSINSTSGELALTVDAITLRTLITHTVNLRCYDSISGNHDITTLVATRIDENEFRPTFDHGNLVADIPESLSIGSTIVNTNATDMDVGPLGEVSYSIGAGGEPFAINGSTGEIRLMSSLDYENEIERRYQFIVTAANPPVGAVSRSGEVLVVINVVNVDDESPRFSEPSYQHRVSETDSRLNVLPSGSQFMVRCVDPDTDPDMISYAVDPATDPGPFRLNTDSGMFFVYAAIDYEIQTLYSFNVVCFDNSPANNSDSATVQFGILPINEFVPEIERDIFGPFFIPETTPVGHLLATADPSFMGPSTVRRYSISDRDAGADGNVTYTLGGDSPLTSFFEVELISGNLTVDREIDFDTLDGSLTSATAFILLHIVGCDTYPVSPNSNCPNIDVNIFIQAVNEFTPTLGRDEYNITVPESFPAGTVILSAAEVNCVDGDIGVGELVGVAFARPSPEILETFRIDSQSGEVSTRIPLDYEVRTSYGFELNCSDNGGLSDRAIVRIEILPENDNMPMFTQASYSFQVSRTTPPNRFPVGTVVATDSDVGLGGELSFTIQSNGYFDITDNGELLLFNSVQNFTASTITFEVFVSDGTNTDDSFVIVQLTEGNTNRPVFELGSRAIRVSELSPLGTSIVTVFCNDTDSGVNGEVRYFFESGNTDNAFSVNAVSGEILVNNVLILPSNTSNQDYTLLVVCEDGGVPRFSDSAVIFIQVFQDDSSPPEFRNDTIIAFINEDVPLNTPVIAIEAVDLDSERLNFRFGSQSVPGVFIIDPGTGLVTTAAALDREFIAMYQMVVVVTEQRDTPGPERSDRAELIIYVRDANDNPPTCNQTMLATTISENYPLGEPIITLDCSDADIGENGALEYALQNNFGVLAISSDGEISLQNMLSFTDRNILVVEVSVSDTGTPSRLTSTYQVTIFIQSTNDNIPEFLNLPAVIEVSEALPMQEVIYHVLAEDPDRGRFGQITYRIVNTEDNAPFGVFSNTGRVFLTQKLNFFDRQMYTLNISAEDSDFLVTELLTILVLDANEYAPTCESYSITSTIREAIPPPQVLSEALDCSDDDLGPNGNITYRIEQEDGNTTAFEVLDDGSVTSLETLDFETEARYELLLIVSDGGSPPRTVNVSYTIVIEPVNEYSPQFDQQLYTQSISEAAGIGSSVISLRATDLDSALHSHGRISYSLTGLQSSVFSISNSGLLRVAGNLDRELEEYYVFMVVAADQGTPSRQSEAVVNITIEDIDDNSPEFTERLYITTINRTTEAGSLVSSVLCVDLDASENAMVTYYLDETSEDSSLFRIDSESGYVFIDNTLPISRSYSFNVICTGPPPLNRSDMAVVSIQVIVDSNITFQSSEYRASVREDTMPVFNILTVTALSSTGAALTYRLLNEMTIFSIDRTTGTVRLTSTLDFETTTLYFLRVEASDSGTPSNKAETFIQIDVINVNDEQPQIDSFPLNVSLIEGPYVDSLPLTVGQLNCSDMDSSVFGEVSFQIVGGNFGNVFGITASGALQLVRGPDYETRQSYSLTIVCEDGGAPPRNDTATVPINILPINDNAPDFGTAVVTISASEALPIGSTVGDPITAIDNDRPPHNSVRYSIMSGNTEPPTFAISSTSGLLTLLQSLDFESVSSYTLVVLAEDNGGVLVPDFPTLNSTVAVQINVEDFNDNTPLLSRRAYSGRVAENARTGDEVTLDSTISCTDVDTGANGMTTLLLMSDTFSIQSNGIIVVNRPLNFEEQRIYFLTIVCQDSGEPARSTEARLDIALRDVNEFGPQFNDSSRYNFLVLESTPVGTIIGQVVAIDEDGGEAGTIVYTFNNDSASDGYFSIDSSTGVITLVSSLDYEMRSSAFNLIAVASDSFGNSDVVAVTIEIINEDDNTPMFAQGPYFFSILENSPEGTIVGRVMCSDADDSADGLSITYVLTNPNVPFNIDVTMGSIVSSGSLDFELSSFYPLQVLCFDSNGNNVSASVTIRLDPFNDFPPVFIDAPYTQSVVENSVIGTSIFQVRATDDDNEEYNTVSFRIVDGNADGRFTIDSGSGVVRISSTVDREQSDTYMLVIEAYNRILPGDTSGSQPLSSTTTLTISVTDQNDNSPSIIPTNPDPVFISESDGPSTVVYVFTCTDPDLLTNGSTVFSITSLSESVQNNFEILQNGTLITTAPVLMNVVIDVTCSDMGTPSRSTTVSISVNTVSMNDHTPVFDEPFYRLNVAETQQIGVDIMCFNATDSDGSNSPDGIVDYSLTLLSSSGDSTNRFAIRRSSGCVFVSVALDISYRSYTYFIVATDRGEPQMSSNATLLIFILDVIRDPPVFVDGPYTRRIFETAAVGTELVTVLCTDQDDNDTVSYNITSGNENNLFSVDPVFGIVVIQNTLDYETSQSHSLSVQCTDSFGLSATESVSITVIPINEFTPTLVASTSIVAENSISLTFVTRLQWIDLDDGLDGQVTFEILSGNIGGAFLITESGDVLVRGELDREVRDYYSLNVSITDQSPEDRRSSTNLVNINITDVNDNRPSFLSDPYIFGPFEGKESIGISIGNVSCFDRDVDLNAQTTYLYNANDGRPSLFSVDSISGEITLTGDLMQRDSNNITFFVLCTDGGFPPLAGRTRVLVVIEEVNRYPPSFTEPSYYVEVAENTRIIEDTILTVTANDSDVGFGGRVQYYLVDDLDNRFFINEDTGELSLLRSLDFEDERNYTLFIEARDGTVNSFVRLSSVAEVSVVVTGVNEFTPECIDPVYVSIINETTQGFVLNFDCIDRDEGEDGVVVYSFQSGNEMNFFAVSDNGDLLIPTNIAANASIEEFELIITVSDSGTMQRSTRIEVILIFSFENLFAPMFEESHFNFTVSELFEVGAVIGMLTATDPDPSIQGRITYTLIGTDLFLVDSSTSELFLSSPLDYESEISHSFTVIAVDSDPFSPLSASAAVTITVVNENDNSPSCDQQFYSVQILSSALPNDPVVLLNCSDADGNSLRYSIISDSRESLFGIDSDTGEVYVSSVLTASQTVVLTVQVSGEDNENTEVSVSIQVLFSNVDPPAFNQTMYVFSIIEDAPLLSSIGTLFASDPDSRSIDLSYSIRDPSLVPEFYVNPNTGEVILTVPLDYETQQQYSVGVVVEDAGSHDGSNRLSASATVLVNIVNTNDNGPVLADGGIYGTTVSQTTSVDTTVLRIVCTDDDDPPFASPTITSTEFTNTPFRLTSLVNGEAIVVVDEPLSGSTAYFVNITCQDAAGLSTDGQIFLFVPEPLAPVFSEPIYEWFVFENEEVGAEIGNVLANSRDESAVTYAITDGDPDNIFYIDPDTGEISLLSSLDYELQRRHGLIVTAVDRANRQSSVLMLIQVLDVNDEVPLTPPSALLRVDQNAPVGFPVGVLQCSDADSQTENSSMTFNFTFVPPSELFSVDEYGIVRVEVLLDDSPVYVLPVMCSDTSSPELVSTGIVTIEVQFLNLYQPLFEFDSYVFSIREDVNTLHFVGDVQATDRDVGSFGEISYSIIEGNPDKFFIQAHSGRIGVLTSLDRETTSSYTLTVAASDGGVSALDSTRMVGTSTVTISILDANDNSPMPKQLSYVQSIPTNHTARTPVLQVECSDPDLLQNGEIDYSIEPPDVDAFVIQSDGTILLAQEQQNQAVFNFFAVCADRGTPVLSSSALVTVTVDIISVRAPVFDDDEYNVTIDENEPISSTIHRVRATSSDPSIGIIYTIESGNDGNAFHVDPLTGDIRVTSPLDASFQQVYSLTVRASTTGHSVLSSFAIVQVTVTDINNNRPFFTPSFYTASIDESSALLLPVVQVECADNDINAQISYFISTDQVVPFNVTQDGLVIVSGEVDYENATVYTIQVTCTDGGEAPMFDTAEVRVDIVPLNEFVPAFSMPEYSLTALENSFGSRIGQVLASDDDSGRHGDITYLLQDPGNFSVVFVDPVSGEVLVANNLDYEQQTFWNLTVIARDGGGAESYSLLHIGVLNVNDVLPVITPPTAIATIPSDSPSGRPLQSFSCIDEDNFGVSLNISSGNDMGYFLLSNNVLLWTGTASNLSSDVVVSLTLRCEDVQVAEQFAESYVAVHIQTEDIVRPTFVEDEYTTSVAEDSEVDTIVLEVSATGPNPDSIRYDLFSSPSSLPFQIEDVSGNITLVTPLDRETTSLYTFVVRATDLTTGAFGISSVQIVIQDANDHSPVVSPTSQTVTLPEDFALSTGFIFFTCMDEDSGANGEVGFSLVTANTDATFAIDDNGLVSLVQPLDFESIKIYDIAVQCTDRAVTSANSATAQLTISVTGVNEYAPVFENITYRFGIEEDLQAGELVGMVNAFDLDDGQDGAVSYSIVSGVGAAFFTVNSSGYIHKNIHPLNASELTEIRFTMRASDGGGRNSDVQVIIEIGDINEPPRFSEGGNYFVVASSNISVGTVLLDFVCFDTDSGENAILSLELLTDSPGLSVDLQTSGTVGVIMGSLTTNATLIPGSYEIEVLCSDQGVLSLGRTTTVVVRVEGVNEAPVFLHDTRVIVVPENEAIGTELVAVNATDEETDVSYQITGGSGRGTFSIDSRTGTISLAFSLDYETTAFYEITVTAFDQSFTNQRSATTTVVVIVTNVNDNNPSLMPPGAQLITISEAAPQSPLRQTYTCTDPDGHNVTISIIPSYPESPFVSSQTDNTLTISLQGSLDYDLQNNYSLEVRCLDSETRVGEGVMLQTSSSLMVSLLPVNDYPPEFISDLTLSVAEDAATGQIIGRVEAVDRDGRGVISYVSPSHNDIFVIDRGSGIITLAGTLDREDVPVYFLTVTASDNDNTQGLAPMTSTATITIRVTDVNDNPPTCPRTTINDVQLSAGSYEYELLVSLECSDIDAGENGDLTYTFLDTSQSQLPEGMFVLNETTGELGFSGTVTVPTSYVIVIIVSDTSDEPLTASVNVVVQVVSTDTTRPRFEPNTFNVSISENTQSPTVIFPGETLLSSLINPSDDIVQFTLRPDIKYSGVFIIDSVNADVTLTNSELIDYDGSPEDREYTLLVDAIVGGNNITASILVSLLDYNDNPPQFTRSFYNGNVLENQPLSTSVTSVMAIDLDSNENGAIFFSIVDSISFTVNSTSGEITTLRQFDREVNERYSFFITATDMGSPPLTSTSLVTVTIGDVNDEPPVFTESVYVIDIDNLSPPGTELINLEITDEDLVGQYVFQIVSDDQNVRTLFTVESPSGVLRQRSERIPDNHENRYTFTVEVNDGIATGSALVVIYVASATRDTVIFEENVPSQSYDAGEFLLLQSFNITESANYTIEGGGEGVFIISSSGVLMTTSTLDREAVDRYVVIVHVVDATTGEDINLYVTVNVGDQNDNAPLFDQTQYSFNISEGTYSAAHSLGYVVAMDNDQPGTGASTVEYSIIGATVGQADIFHVDPTSGEFFVVEGSVLDREKDTNHTIVVRGRDFGEPSAQSSLTFVVVSVGDVNDNDPEFIPLDVVEFLLSVSEDTPPLSPLTKIISVLPGGILKDIPEISYIDRDSTSEVTATLMLRSGKLKYNLAQASPNSVMLVSTDKFSKEDNGTVLEIILRDEPKEVEQNPVNRTITVIVGDVSPPSTGGIEPETTNFFQTEAGIAVLVVVSLVILALLLFLVCLCVCCVRKIRQEKDPLRNA